MNSVSGVTLIELMIAASIMGVILILTKFGADLLKNMAQERTFVEAQQQGELAMYRMKIDVSSAHEIFFISSGTLSMTLYNFRQGYDVATSTNLFSQVNMGTVTYQFVETNNKSYLQRLAIFPGVKTSSETFLTNILVSTRVLTMGGMPYDSNIFAPGHEGVYAWPTGPYESVQVFLNLRLPYGQKIKQYHQELSKRGSFI